jgi:transposase
LASIGIGMEACLSAHFVSRTLRQLGREPRIIPAIDVKPFVKGQKNDYNGAEAVAAALEWISRRRCIGRLRF